MNAIVHVLVSSVHEVVGIVNSELIALRCTYEWLRHTLLLFCLSMDDCTAAHFPYKNYIG